MSLWCLAISKDSLSHADLAMALKLSAARNFLLQGLHMYLESPFLSVIGRSSTLLSLPGMSALWDSLENSATETIGATALLFLYLLYNILQLLYIVFETLHIH